MKALIDGDILRYEIGFAAETGWQQNGVPSWDYVCDLLHSRIDRILYETGASSYQLYLTAGPTFRYDIAKRKPYKALRKSKKPWHFRNLTAYLTDVLGAKVVSGIEADDAIAIDHVSSKGSTIVCSRDKDLRQLPGWFYSWELGRQPSFGPVQITQAGSLSLSEDGAKLTGTGFAWFCAQVLMGDPTDNIPGLPGWGPVHTYTYLHPMLEDVASLYPRLADAYWQDYDEEGNWEQELLEQGQLCWLVRNLNDDGSPVLWELGMVE